MNVRYGWYVNGYVVINSPHPLFKERELQIYNLLSLTSEKIFLISKSTYLSVVSYINILCLHTTSVQPYDCFKNKKILMVSL